MQKRREEAKKEKVLSSRFRHKKTKQTMAMEEIESESKKRTLLDLPDDVLDVIWTALPPGQDRRNFLDAHPCVRESPAILHRIAHLRYPIQEGKRTTKVFDDMVRSTATSLLGAKPRRLTLAAHSPKDTHRMTRFLDALASDLEARDRIKDVECIELEFELSWFCTTQKTACVISLLEHLCPRISRFVATNGCIDSKALHALSQIEHLRSMQLSGCRISRYAKWPGEIKPLEGVEELDLVERYPFFQDRYSWREGNSPSSQYFNHALCTPSYDEENILTGACPALRVLRVPNSRTQGLFDTVEHLHVDNLYIGLSVAEMRLPRLRSICVTHCLVLSYPDPNAHDDVDLGIDAHVRSASVLASIPRAEDSSPVLIVNRYYAEAHSPDILERLLSPLRDTPWALGLQKIYSSPRARMTEDFFEYERTILLRFFPNASFREKNKR